MKQFWLIRLALSAQSAGLVILGGLMAGWFALLTFKGLALCALVLAAFYYIYGLYIKNLLLDFMGEYLDWSITDELNMEVQK